MVNSKSVTEPYDNTEKQNQRVWSSSGVSLQSLAPTH